MSGRFTPPFTQSQQRFLAICPKVTSTFSIVGSLYIIQHVLRSPVRRKRVYTRLLLVMSVMDCIYAVKCFVSTWPLPVETGAYGAVGTTQTCTMAAFWGQGGSLSSAVYNGSLTCYYLLTIRHGWTQSQFQNQSKRRRDGDSSTNRATAIHRIRQSATPPLPSWEWLLHVVPLTIGWGTALASLPLRLFNPIGWTCWIGPWPLGCDASDNATMPCQRGENAKLYRWLFFHGILWATLLFVAIAMMLIYLKIRTDERASERYDFAAARQQAQSQAHRDEEKQQDGIDSDRALLEQHGVEDEDPGASSSSPFTTTTTHSKSFLSLGSGSSIFASGVISSKRALFGRSSTLRKPRKGMEHEEEDFNNTTEYSCSAPFHNASSSFKRKRRRQKQQKQKLSRRFAEQAFWYILSFFLAWIFPMAQFAVTNAPSGTLYYPLLALTVLLNPLQGLWNALIYIRPRYLRYRRKRQQQAMQPKPRLAAVSSQASHASQQFFGLSLSAMMTMTTKPRKEQPSKVSQAAPGEASDTPNASSSALEDAGHNNQGGGNAGAVAAWQAIVSAVGVQGDDDEDEWEEDQGDQEEDEDANEGEVAQSSAS